MLVNSFFIIDFENYDNVSNVELTDNAYVCYKISLGSINAIETFYAKLFLSPRQHSFCFFLNIDRLLNENRKKNIIEFFVSGSFHARYLKSGHDDPVVLVPVDQNSDVADLFKAFKEQGYDQVRAIPVCNNIDTGGQKNELQNVFNIGADINNLSEDYIKSIKQVVSCDSSFFFFLDHPQKIDEVVNILRQAEETIQLQMPQTYALLKENMSLRGEEHKLVSKTQLLQEQLDSLDSYHGNYNSSFNRQKRQITELLQFYKNEYEILPLWYKRFGHVLKVLMGKRSFKSLFNDKVKKYKD